MIIVIAGSGKTTLRTELLRPCDVEKAISFTTHSPRKMEQNGKDYYFVSGLSNFYNPKDIHIIFLDVPKRILIERLQERENGLSDIYQCFRKDNNLS